MAISSLELYPSSENISLNGNLRIQAIRYSIDMTVINVF
jgi:hypothetical protein